MQWAIIFSLTVLFSFSLGSEVSTILKSGEFNYPFVVDEEIRLSETDAVMYVSTSHRCVTGFIVSTYLEEDATITIGRVAGFDEQKNEYTFNQLGSFTLLKGEPTTLPLDGPVCASTWQLTVKIASAQKVFKDVTIVHTPVQDSSVRKRADVTCSPSTTAQYPPECSSATDGAKCLSTGVCGCARDTDCFGNTDFPFCLLKAGQTTGACEWCFLKATTTNPNDDHLACLPRYPGLEKHPDDNVDLPNERAAPRNYFREVCVRQTATGSGGGACQRCNQAPLITSFTFTPALNQGASGTVHCNTIRPDRPICMDEAYMTDVGGVFDINFRGACRPCTVNKACSKALPLTPICDVAGGGRCVKCSTNAQCSTIGGANNCQKDGSCKSCTSNADCGTLDGGETPNQPTCNTATGICEIPFQCTDNPSCAARGLGANCQADKTCLTCTATPSSCGPLDGGETPGQPICNTGSGICGPCTANANCNAGVGGNNCQATGACRTCTSNADCGALDGGEKAGQTMCNTATGICEDPCTGNLWCSQNGKVGKNCQKDGTCRSCLSNADCGALDGGEIPDQTECDIPSNICVPPFSCVDNNDCVTNGKAGNNCQSNKACVSCTGITTCGALDGGLTPGQPNCNIASRQCVGACSTNEGCVGTQGKNCFKNGICFTCVTDDDCKNSNGGDGGQTPNQPICNAGICEDACTSNAACAGKAGPNCQKSGACIRCTTNANCGPLDGGETPNEAECNTATGICQPPFQCTDNDHCAAAQQPGKNCQADKSCKTCKTNADCGALDGGKKARQPVCNTVTGICEDCKSNDNCPTGSKNCGIDGLCYQCSNAVGGTGCGALDGPPGGPSMNQPNCDAQEGVCVDGCTLDSHCTIDLCKPFCNIHKHCCAECVSNTHCPHPQWRGDQTKLTVCSAATNTCVQGCSIDADCSGATPACAPTLGRCVECLYNDHCGEESPFCHPTDMTCTGENGWGASGVDGVAGIVIGSIALFLVVVVVVVLIITKGGSSTERF